MPGDELPGASAPIIPASPSPAPAPAAAPSPSPSSAAAPPSSVVVATPAPDSSAAPAPATPSPAPAAEPAAPAAAADTPVQPAKSFLTEAIDKGKPAEAKPAEAPKPAEAATPAEAKPGETPALPAEAAAATPIAWEYTIPEEVNLNAEGTLKAKVNFDDESKTRVNAMLQAFSENPRDQANQQALVDFHIERLAEQQKQTSEFNRNFWNDTRKEWRGRWASDPEIGGSGIETTKAAIARVLDIGMRWQDTSPANKAFHEDLEQAWEMTGAGDHPAVGRLFARLARFMDESPQPMTNIKPPPDNSKPPGRARLRDQYKGMP